jgi:hypothetical protein
MTRSKLSDLEKQEIISLFEQQQETIVSLAQRYQVSSSTIRRLLKSSTPEPEQTITPSEHLAADSKPKLVQKHSQPSPLSLEDPALPTPDLETSRTTSDAIPRKLPYSKKLQKSAKGRHLSSEEISLDPSLDSRRDAPAISTPFPPVLKSSAPESEALSLVVPAPDELNAILEDIGHGLEQSLASSAVEEDEDDDDFDDLEDESDDLDDLDELSSESVSPTLQLRPEGFIEVMPLEQAILPKTCYLVIDRTAELVTRPLKDFGELGQVPEHEVQSCTLPVFDNHRIARRFSHRTQRIIKVPNGNMLKATSHQLSAKGITRLLVNGNIYAL